jgi:hypothetical protein
MAHRSLYKFMKLPIDGQTTRGMDSQHKFVVRPFPHQQILPRGQQSAGDRGILAATEFKTLDDLREEAGKLTWRFYSTLKEARAH